MRVCVIYNTYVPYTTGIYVEEAFRKLGHDVIRSAPGRQHPKSDFYFRIDDGSGTTEDLPSPNAFWSIDGCSQDGRTPRIGRYYDNVYEASLSYMHVHDDAKWLPLAASFEQHFYPCLRSDFDYDFALLGSRYGMRDTIISQLATHKDIGDYYYSKAPYTDIPIVYSRSRSCLNITKLDITNMRTFEACMAGTVLLQQKVGEDKSGLYILFSEDSVFKWETVEEAAHYIKWIKDNPEQANRMAATAQHNVINNHTYERRMEKVLKDVFE